MSEEELVLYVVIVFIVIAGVWLTILSYLVLTRMSSRREEKKEKEEPVTEKKEEEAPKAEKEVTEESKAEGK